MDDTSGLPSNKTKYEKFSYCDSSFGSFVNCDDKDANMELQ